MEIHTLSSGGYSVRYFSFGKTNGAPLVIIPGAAVRSVMESADLISEQYRLMAEDHCIYVIDRREQFDSSYDVYAMADDVIFVMDTLSLKNAYIYGVSQGGIIAQIIAADRGDLVRKLILCSTAACIDETAAGVLGQWEHLALSGDRDGLMLSFAEKVYSSAYCQKYRDAFLSFGRTVTDDELKRFAVTAGCMKELDITGKLADIRCPVLVLAGENDMIFSTDQAERLADLTGGELFIYRNEAHGVYDEEPDVLVRIKAFLEKNEEGELK